MSTKKQGLTPKITEKQPIGFGIQGTSYTQKSQTTSQKGKKPTIEAEKPLTNSQLKQKQQQQQQQQSSSSQSQNVGDRQKEKLSSNNIPPKNNGNTLQEKFQNPTRKNIFPDQQVDQNKKGIPMNQIQKNEQQNGTVMEEEEKEIQYQNKDINDLINVNVPLQRTYSYIRKEVNRTLIYPVQGIRLDISNSFELSVGELLRQQLKPFQVQSKKMLYDEYIKSLTEEDKAMKMKYIRYVDDCQFPTNVAECQIDVENQIEIVENAYQYTPPNGPHERHWYINFADQNLFHYYNSSLFAQDEIQVSEHPLLAHCLERANYLTPRVPDLLARTHEGMKPTPVLITNCHRLGTVNINADAQFKNGLYGNNFQTARPNDIQKRMTVFREQKTVSNIIAMAALGYQRGEYTREQIEYTLKTAFKSFFMARIITDSYDSKGICVINTGNWGCGAFGNNLVLIALIQLIAAQLAGVDMIKYHTFNKQGTQGLKIGIQKYQEYIQALKSKRSQPMVKDIIEHLYSLKMKWGVSDGN